MKFVPTHNSLDLNELVMIKDGVVYTQTEDFMDVEAQGCAFEYNEDYLVPLKVEGDVNMFSLIDFYKSYREIHDKVPSYRLGQHFINLFIKDEESCQVMIKGLWNKDFEQANIQIHNIIEVYQWDPQDLPLFRKEGV